MTAAFVALGANLGDPCAQVESAFEDLKGIARTRLVARSSLYRSAPLGYEEQPDFVNAVAGLETELAARGLLEALLGLERARGRARSFPNAPRTLDLDLLLYAGEVIDEPGLRVPHPRMHERAFVLAPLVEIAPDISIPGKGAARALLQRCATQRVERIPRR
jgi:2-amino-4-hydroxy-6-hydroxymethyldihydropteridine diphosphokinase